MTWDEYCLMLLRQVIDDDEAPYTYSDQRLTKLLASAAVMVQVEKPLKNTYDVNLTTYEITPDPLTLDPPDYLFLILIVYKSACLLAQSKPLKNGYDSIKVVDDLTTVEIKGKNGSTILAANSYCDMYQKIWWDAATNGTDGVIRYGIVVNTYGENQQVHSNFR